METRLVRSVDIIQHAIDSTAAPLAIFSISINSLSVYTVSSILTLGNFFILFFFCSPWSFRKSPTDPISITGTVPVQLNSFFDFPSQTTIESRSLRHVCIHICRVQGFLGRCVQLRQIDGRDIDQVFPVSFGYLTSFGVVGCCVFSAVSRRHLISFRLFIFSRIAPCVI